MSIRTLKRVWILCLPLSVPVITMVITLVVLGANSTIPVSVVISSSATPNPALVGESVAAGFSAVADTSSVNSEAIANGPSYSWSITSVRSRETSNSTWTNAAEGSYTASVASSGETATLSAQFNVAAYWEIIVSAHVTYTDNNGNTWVGNGSNSCNITVVSVGIVAAPDSGSLLGPGLACLNAQDQYKKAKYKAVVKPADTTASISITSTSDASDASPSPTSVLDGGTVEVTGGSKTGAFTIAIKHNLRSDCNATSTGKIFKIIFKKIEPENQYPGASPLTELDNTINAPPWCKAFAKDGESLGSVIADTAGGPTPNDAKIPYGANLTSTYSFYIATEPSDAYSGNVGCDGSVEQKLTSGSNLRVWEDSTWGFISIAAAWAYQPFTGIPVKITASAEWMADKSVVAGFDQGIGVKTPDMTDFVYSPEQQITLSQKDIPFAGIAKLVGIPSPPSKGWTNGKFKANDQSSKGIGRHDMCVSAERGDVSGTYLGVYSSLRATSDAWLSDEIIKVQMSNYKLVP